MRAAWLRYSYQDAAGGLERSESLRWVELKVEAIALDHKGSPLVVLREKDGQRAVFIWVGLAEAQAISMQLEGRKPPRPFTHDLLLLVIGGLQAKVEEVVITNMQVDTYYADLKLRLGEELMTIDCRPSDAIAVALRANAPIYIGEGLLERLEEARRETEAGEEGPPRAVVVDTGETTVH